MRRLLDAGRLAKFVLAIATLLVVLILGLGYEPTAFLLGLGPPDPLPASLRTVGAATAQVAEGRVAYEVPAKMKQHHLEMVVVKIARGIDLDDEELLEGLSGLSEPRIRSLTTSSTMSVRLTGSPSTMFDIQPLSSETQDLFENSALWEFNVTPLRGGTGELTVSVDLVLRAGDDEGTTSLPSFSGAVDVQVSTFQTIAGYVGGSVFWAGPIGLAAGAAILVRRTSQRPSWLRRRRARRQVFISYRRADSGGWTKEIYRRLRAEYGDDSIFMDIDGLIGGQDFASVLRARILASDAVVAMIGPGWGTTVDGTRNINDDDDFVRQEVALALEADCAVIPVLVDGAELPAPIAIPDDLHGLLRLQAVEVALGQLDEGTAKLIRAIDAATADRHTAVLR